MKKTTKRLLLLVEDALQNEQSDLLALIATNAGRRICPQVIAEYNALQYKRDCIVGALEALERLSYCYDVRRDCHG